MNRHPQKLRLNHPDAQPAVQLNFLDAMGEEPRRSIADGAVLLRKFVDKQQGLIDSIADIATTAPFRIMTVPGGGRMSVAMTSCGTRAWVADPSGYRYSEIDPLTGTGWPAIPQSFLALAQSAASEAGYANFNPDSCLINRYAPGARMGLHQDRNEGNGRAPIVSVSLGLPAIFLFGGMTRNAACEKITLESGDVVVWGGPSRFAFHGVRPVAPGDHPLTGRYRYNLTFRQAG